MIDFLESYWSIVAANPLVFLIFGPVLVSATAGLTRLLLRHALEVAHERLAAAQEDVVRLQGEKSELLKKLEDHGESITEIKAELAALPRHFVSEGPPRLG